MKLYGTTTSPYVRRVRIVAAEVGEPIELVNTATDAGQAQLRAVSPIRKVPVAELDGRTLFDSRVIADALIAKHGWGALTPPADPLQHANAINAIEAALDSVIQTFYLKRDEGIDAATSVYGKRQLERADAIFAWLEPQLAGSASYGLAEITLVCALEWMEFRAVYSTDRTPFTALRAALAERDAVAATRPHA